MSTAVPPPKAAKWDYAPAPESFKPAIAPEHGLYIDGKFTPAKSGRKMDVINPATEEHLTKVAEAGKADVDRACEAAKKAFRGWSRMKPRERAKLLFRVARKLQERAREFAVLETLNNGKPIKESRDQDVPESAKHFFYHAGWCDKLRYAVPGGHEPGPVGVCGQIIPWNFPLMMAAWKLAPALACGNTCVLKPAETTPLTAIRLAEVFRDCDFPPGVVNIITGGPEAGKAIAQHPGFDKIAFTGSTEVGRMIVKGCAGRSVRLTMELGGKGAHLIFADAAIDQAVEGAVQGIFSNQGQVCCAGSRLLVEESIADIFQAKLLHRMSSLRLGDPMDKNTDVGAINSAPQLKRIQGYVKIAREEGLKVLESGTGEIPKKGFWCRPTALAGVQPANVVAREEIFGPVVCLMTFRTVDEAVSRANDTPFGLSAGVWTEKSAKMFDVARRLRAGVVWCNGFNLFDAASPFGGMKESGFGREGGRHGLMEYMAH
ncbi:MAG: aldehyde dehydrogenase family protein [Planctomycetes bacterium]|nr:aldehyde dehydrogenase family protein [Planctomycetota bacterium]